MRVLILAYGSRGDVQPLLALGVGLGHAGHQVCLAAPTCFAAPTRARGLGFLELPGAPTALMGAVTAHTRSRLGRLVAMARHFAPIAGAMITGACAASAGAHVIVHSIWTIAPGRMAAQARGIPSVSASMFPLLATTAAFPAVPFSALALGPRGSALTHDLIQEIYWQGSRLIWGLARQAHPQIPRWSACLRPGPDDPMPLLHAFSPIVVPRPPDWGPQVHMTGYWSLSAGDGWRPPAALEAFLARGEPPVVVGFGSMVLPSAQVNAHCAALAQSGRRVIWLTGWGGAAPTHLPSTMIALQEAPHDWLLPQAAALVTHGGAGSVAAALRAGVPTATVAFMADHTFWGQRVAALGAGPPPTSATRLTPARLSETVARLVEDPGMRQRAALVGAALRAEDGIGRAVALIERAAR